MSYFKDKTIVVPIDFSELSDRAIDKVLEMADATSSLHLIHVIEPTLSVISVDPALPIPPSYEHELQKQAVATLEKRFGSGDYARFQQHCVIGDPGSEIVNLAQSLHADLIVMPSHGRSGLSRLLLGSVAERVSRTSSCPVLILRGEM